MLGRAWCLGIPRPPQCTQLSFFFFGVIDAFQTAAARPQIFCLKSLHLGILGKGRSQDNCRPRHVLGQRRTITASGRPCALGTAEQLPSAIKLPTLLWASRKVPRHLRAAGFAEVQVHLLIFGNAGGNFWLTASHLGQPGIAKQA